MKLRVMVGLRHFRASVAISSDSKFLFTHYDDGTVRISRLTDGKELCRFAAFRDGSWVVFDPEGRFDTSDVGNTKNLHWAVGNELFPLGKYRHIYNDPGLLAKHLGLHFHSPRKLTQTSVNGQK